MRAGIQSPHKRKVGRAVPCAPPTANHGIATSLIDRFASIRHSSSCRAKAQRRRIVIRHATHRRH
jgi:hypothetical protein